jgi:hypothetical protein
MNLPSFTAEASLYKTTGHYRLTTGWASGADAPVLPSTWPPSFYCVPHCGPCKPYGGHYGIMACIDFNCDIYLRPCYSVLHLNE